MGLTVDSPPRRRCTNGCGFFGSPANHDLCSKCYEDLYLVNQMAMLTRINVKTSNNSGDGLVGEFWQSSDDVAPEKKRSCQYFCDKKVGLLDLRRCRCGGTFCRLHRSPEEHACRYDYKAAGRDDFFKKNPACKADKLKTRV